MHLFRPQPPDPLTTTTMQPESPRALKLISSPAFAPEQSRPTPTWSIPTKAACTSIFTEPFVPQAKKVNPYFTPPGRLHPIPDPGLSRRSEKEKAAINAAKAESLRGCEFLGTSLKNSHNRRPIQSLFGARSHALRGNAVQNYLKSNKFQPCITILKTPGVQGRASIQHGLAERPCGLRAKESADLIIVKTVESPGDVLGGAVLDFPPERGNCPPCWSIPANTAGASARPGRPEDSRPRAPGRGGHCFADYFLKHRPACGCRLSGIAPRDSQGRAPGRLGPPHPPPFRRDSGIGPDNRRPEALGECSLAPAPIPAPHAG